MTTVYLYDEEEGNRPHYFCYLGVVETTTYEDRRLGRTAYIDHRCEWCKLNGVFKGEA